MLVRWAMPRRALEQTAHEKPFDAFNRNAIACISTVTGLDDAAVLVDEKVCGHQVAGAQSGQADQTQPLISVGTRSTTAFSLRHNERSMPYASCAADVGSTAMQNGRGRWPAKRSTSSCEALKMAMISRPSVDSALCCLVSAQILQLQNGQAASRKNHSKVRRPLPPITLG